MFQTAFGTASVTVPVERPIRFTRLARPEDRVSQPVVDALIMDFGTLPQPARRAITMDRRTEVSRAAMLPAIGNGQAVPALAPRRTRALYNTP